MLYVEVDEKYSVVILEPHGSLSKSDFISAAERLAPYLEIPGAIKGIIIHVKFFPAWDSFAALVAHLKFVKEHHKKVSRVAFSTDAVGADVVSALAEHFAHADIKVFTFKEIELAKAWIDELT